jgi:restriction endonuclease Mrr
MADTTVTRWSILDLLSGGRIGEAIWTVRIIAWCMVFDPTTEARRRVAWALGWLRREGLVTRTDGGGWKISPAGRDAHRSRYG